MSQKVAVETFRSAFKLVNKENLNWFPGHMDKGLKQMQHKLRSVDCIVEVHDARIPFSGRNSNFKYTVSGIKPHILVLNKKDLIDKHLLPKIEEKLRAQGDCSNVIFTNCKDHTCKGVSEILPLAEKLIKNSDRYNRTTEEDYCMMIIGVPNVGKSSLINKLRNKHLRKSNATHVGAAPGITRSVLNKIKVSEKPLVYLLDTPGILMPNIPSTEIGLKLALCATLQDHLIGEEIIADYLLYWLNKQKRFKYVKHFKLKEACDDILEVLTQVAINNNKMLRLKDVNGTYIKRPDFNAAARMLVNSFRNGDLGNIMLDEDLL